MTDLDKLEQEALKEQVGDVAYEFTTREGGPAATLYADKYWVAYDDLADLYFETKQSVALARGDAPDLRPTETALNDLVGTGQIADAMLRAENLAVEQGLLDPDRIDARLFTAGPPDPWQTLCQLGRQSELDTQEVVPPSFDL